MNLVLAVFTDTFSNLQSKPEVKKTDNYMIEHKEKGEDEEEESKEEEDEEEKK